MPRNLLRVALVAAILPALAPEISSAQTVKAAATVRSTAPAQPAKKGVAGWLQRMRGEKPAPATGKIIKVSDENPFSVPAVKSDTPFDLEGNADVQLLKSSQSGRRRPTVQVQEFEPASTRQQRVVAPPAAVQPRADAVINPAQSATRTSSPAANSNIDNPFPDDVPTKPRSRHVATPAGEADFATPIKDAGQPAMDVATPVDGVEEPADALPIESAAPPADVNAGFQAAEGTTPRYRRTNMAQESNSIEVPAVPEAADPTPAPTNDARFANPVPAQPIGRVATRMNGGPAVINGPQSSLPIYGQPATPVYAPGQVYIGPPGYAQLDAALYPSPRQDIPPYVGSTMITNQAFDPHEMLYAHRYRGLYGPFYHKTTRSWVLTPLGVCKHEKRVLVGTEVRVNYKSSISPFSLFFPPVLW